MQNSILLSNSTKVDCAKECPCGVSAIPVPDQWLEVMVTGGFKVWHIMFIVIAFIVTLVVVYCCFHRCRIPRTKQEIEADLMRTNLATKFRDHLQQLPNEPTTFVEALKKVQLIEEKLEQDDVQMTRDLGARKRMGWLKLKGKGEKDKDNIDREKGLEETVDRIGDFEKKVSDELLPISDGKPTVVSDNPILDKAKGLQDPLNINENSKLVDPKALDPPLVEKDKKKLDDAPDQQEGVEMVDYEEATIKNHIPSVGSKPVRAKRKQKPNLNRTKGTTKQNQADVTECASPPTTIEVLPKLLLPKREMIESQKSTERNLLELPAEVRRHPKKTRIKRQVVHRSKRNNDIQDNRQFVIGIPTSEGDVAHSSNSMKSSKKPKDFGKI